MRLDGICFRKKYLGRVLIYFLQIVQDFFPETFLVNEKHFVEFGLVLVTTDILIDGSCSF